MMAAPRWTYSPSQLAWSEGWQLLGAWSVFHVFIAINIGISIIIVLWWCAVNVVCVFVWRVQSDVAEPQSTQHTPRPYRPSSTVPWTHPLGTWQEWLG